MKLKERLVKNVWLSAAAILLAAVLLVFLVVTAVRVVLDAVNKPIVSEQTTEEAILEPTLNTHLGRFYHGQNSYLQYEGETEAHLGIDVSSHQMEINWQEVGNTPVEFAIIRAGYRGYTEGAIVEDKYFADNLRGAKDIGLKIGIYFFSQAISEEEAIEEAEFVLSLLGDTELSYPVFFDWEDIEPEARTDEMTSLEITACAKAFCTRIEQAGYQAGVYFNQTFGYQELKLLELEDYIFWLADYSIPCHYRYDYDFLQYTNLGRVSGISTSVDLNLGFD